MLRFKIVQKHIKEKERAAGNMAASLTENGRCSPISAESGQEINCSQIKNCIITMAQIKVRFYHTLNDFILPALNNQEIIQNSDRKTSVKDLIESFNVPHTEVELILVNGTAVDFNYIVQHGDLIEVYPALMNPGIQPLLLLRPEPPQPPAFIVDTNLGKLARYLRLLGFDCLYRNDYEDEVIAQTASEQQRTVLTRDRALLQRRIITHGYFVRSDMPKVQVKEVLKRFDLSREIKPLTRCTSCNGKLVAINKQEIEHRLEPLTKKYYNQFLICPECDQIYWEGSHCARVGDLIDAFTEESKKSVSS